MFFLLTFAAISLSVCVISLILLHVLPTGLSPVNSFVSSYALNRYGMLYGIQAFCSGLAAGFLAFAMVKSGLLFASSGLVALVSYAISRLLIPFFPTDVKGQSTIKGKVHLVLAIVSFSGIAVATAHVHFIHATPAEMLFLNTFSVITIISTLALVLTIRLNQFKAIRGLIERGIYFGALGWIGSALVCFFSGVA